LITDGNGQTYQTLAYEPWGGQVVDIKHYSDTYDEPYRFTGYEKDGESGLNYASARYYDNDVSIFISVDPMWSKYPSLSSYAYVANNPIMLLDPDGKFPIPLHWKLISNAFSKTTMPQKTANMIAFWGSLYADAFAHKDIHLDNKFDFKSIASGYILAKYNFMKGMQLGNFTRAGESLHTIADFYSHSNYISLYRIYAFREGLSNDIDDIPTFSEAMNNPALSGFLYMLEKELKTGTFGEGSVAIEWLKDRYSNDVNSHGQNNLDSPNSPKGKLPYFTEGSLHDAARATAQKDLDQIVTEIVE
jgi:RHS repeat-associated protein